MKFLIVNGIYEQLLQWLYAAHPGLENRPYDEQVRVRIEGFHGGTTFYPYNLAQLGHEAHEIRVNDPHTQKAWAREHGVRVSPDRTPGLRLRRGVVPWPRWHTNKRWITEILEAQIRHYRPDVLLVPAMNQIPTDFLKAMRPYTRLMVGLHDSTPLPDGYDWATYDLALVTFPPFVDWFRERGVPSELVLYGFDPRVLDRTGQPERDVPISFVGSFFDIHSNRTEFVEALCEQVDIQVWAPDVKRLRPDSPIRRSYQGQAWGQDLFRTLGRSQITLNVHHGGVPPYANNMRLYEATGMGALLITDWKQNLGDLFEPGTEVVAYHSLEECAEQIRYYLAHPAEREAIARAGQARTLRDHTYRQRMEELVGIIERYMKA